MPQAVPLPHERYVQYLRTEPSAPRVEYARTHEVKGKRRHGEGRAFRLFGPHAVVLGRWTGQSMTPEETQRYSDWYGDEEGRPDPWGRLIRPDEIDLVAHQITEEKLREGWNPPRWHWRFYWEAIVRVLNNLGLVHEAAYNEVRLTWRIFLRRLWDGVKMRLFGREEQYVPFQVGGEHDADDDEGLTV